MTNTTNTTNTFPDTLRALDGRLAALLDELHDANYVAQQVGRMRVPGCGQLYPAIVTARKAIAAALAPPVDVQARSIREAEENLEHQRRLLDWAASLPHTHEGRSEGIARYKAGVRSAEMALKRARGEAIAEDPLDFNERLDRLIAIIGVRAARERMGLPVEPLPEIPPLPRR